jgi:hypothetical protein
MSQTIQGTYKNGTISLDRLPEGVAEARVVVEFVEQPPRAPERSTRRRGITFYGMFAPSNGQFTSDEELERVKKSWNAKPDDLES